jgi:hypothetical protein
VCAEERRELSLPAAAGGLKTMGYGRMATHRPGGVLPGGHSPSVRFRRFEPLLYSRIWFLNEVKTCQHSSPYEGLYSETIKTPWSFWSRARFREFCGRLLPNSPTAVGSL